MAHSSWQPWAELATGEGFSSDRGHSESLGLGSAQIHFRNCTTILGLSWSRDPVSLLKIESLLTRISGGDWSAAARVALQHCRYMLLGIIRLRDKVPVYLWLHQARG